MSYKVDTQCESYCLAALDIAVPPLRLGPRTDSLSAIPMERTNKFTKFYCQLPLLREVAEWRIQASLIEGYLFPPSIKRIRLHIFPRENREEDRYFECIPSTWTVCNNLDKTYVSNHLLHDMMTLSLLNYQADEYMEVVGKRYARDRIDAIRNIVEDFFHQPGLPYLGDSGNGTRSMKTNGTALNCKTAKVEKDKGMLPGDSDASVGSTHIATNVLDLVEGIDTDTVELSQVRTILEPFINYVLKHPIIAQASSYDQTLLRVELRIFLLAHITQAEDNARLASQQSLNSSITIPFETPRCSYFEWARTTSAAHMSCPYSFSFMTCFLSGMGTACFETAEEKYLAQDLCRHLSTMCRMYDDFGSLARDRAETDLNSVNFPEFGRMGQIPRIRN